MASQNNRSFFSGILTAVCFLIACMFLYWAVEYWVYHNADRGRYEISKLQTAGGGDSWSVWKLDRRAGRLEFCSLSQVERKGVKVTELACLPSKEPEYRDPRPPQADSSALADGETIVSTVPDVISSTPAETTTPQH